MKLPSDKTKYSAAFEYVEVGVWIPPNDEFPKGKLARSLTGKKGSDPMLFNPKEVRAIADKYDNEGIYTSVFQYNSRNFTTAAYMSSLYFDLDSADLELSLSECIRLYEYLRQYMSEHAIRVYFSGAKGFHVECEALALNTGTSEDLSNIFAFIAHTLAEELDITTMDFQVYDVRRMWRLANSRHQKTGLYKIPCAEFIKNHAPINYIKDYAVEPRWEAIPEQVFELSANVWYREFVYKYEQDKLAQSTSQQDLLSRFLEQGSTNIKIYSDEEKIFDKYKLFKGCPAVRDLDAKARTQHHLEHYERLFLCSLLTYTLDSIKYLHEILSQCSDYNWEVSQAHIQDWVKRREYGIGGRPFTCQKAKQVGILCSGCDALEPRRKVVELDNHKFVETEEFSSPSPIRFSYSIPKGK